MNCRTAERWLSRGLDRPLDRPVQEALEAHLAGCAKCRPTASEIRGLRARLSDLPVPEPLPHFWSRLETRLAVSPAPEPQAFWLRWSLRAIPASLALIAGFLGAMMLFQPVEVELSQPEALLIRDDNPIVETRKILDDTLGNREIAILFAADERFAGSGRVPRP